MGFSFYSLIEAGLLCINALAILSEKRFLSRISDNQYSGDVKGQMLNFIRSIRTVMRIPLIALNLITIFFLILFG